MNKTSTWYVSDVKAFVVTVCYRIDRSNESNSSRKRYKEREGWTKNEKKSTREEKIKKNYLPRHNT